MKEIIISDENNVINKDEIIKKIEKLDVYAKKAQARVEHHINELTKIADKFEKERDFAEGQLAEHKEVKLDL